MWSSGADVALKKMAIDFGYKNALKDKMVEGQIKVLLQKGEIDKARAATEWAHTVELKNGDREQALAEIQARHEARADKLEQQGNIAGANDERRALLDVWKWAKETETAEAMKKVTPESPQTAEDIARQTAIRAGTEAKKGGEEEKFQPATIKGTPVAPENEYNMAAAQEARWKEKPPTLADGTVDHLKVARLAKRMKELKKHLGL